MEKIEKPVLPDEVVMNKIYRLREVNVMLDSDLAELYGIETRRLNEQVKRNLSRFPADFMFQLNEEEYKNLMSHFATPSWGGRRTLPYVFTEHGVLMLSSVLNSERAIKVNIQIMRIYIKLRRMLLAQKDILHRIEKLEYAFSEHDHKIIGIFQYLKQLENIEKQNSDNNERPKIGFKRYD